MEEYSWPCARCDTANTIPAPSKVVGVAFAEGLVVIALERVTLPLLSAGSGETAEPLLQ